MRRALLVGACAAAVGLAPSATIAQEAPATSPTHRIDTMREARDVPGLIRLLDRGGTDAEVDAALEALRDLRDPSTFSTFDSFTRHRRLAARRLAYLGVVSLGQLTPPPPPRRGQPAPPTVDHAAVLQTLRRGLRDHEPTVRSVAARGIGHLPPADAEPAVDDLFVAFEAGVLEAAAALGAIAPASALLRYHEHLERMPLGAMLEGYARFVRRDDLSVRAKRDIVARLAEVAGLSVRTFLVEWRRDLPQDADADLRTAIERTIRRIPLDDRGRRHRR